VAVQSIHRRTLPRRRRPCPSRHHWRCSARPCLASVSSVVAAAGSLVDDPSQPATVRIQEAEQALPAPRPVHWAMVPPVAQPVQTVRNAVSDGAGILIHNEKSLGRQARKSCLSSPLLEIAGWRVKRGTAQVPPSRNTQRIHINNMLSSIYSGRAAPLLTISNKSSGDP
jgi:hypothetical protein